MQTVSEDKYGTKLRIYDNGGETMDRYTIIPPKGAKYYRESNGAWLAVGCNETPFHPQGFGMYVEAVPGEHLGKRVVWGSLPTDVQRLAQQSFPEYAPQ